MRDPRRRVRQRRAVVPVIALATLLVACSFNLRAADTPLYTGLEPDAFMHDWLVLGPISITETRSPDEVEQRAAFAKDWLTAAGGEARAAAKAGTSVAVNGNDHAWQRVQSDGDVIDLSVPKKPVELSVAYAFAEIQMPDATRGLLGVWERRRREGVAERPTGSRALDRARLAAG